MILIAGGSSTKKFVSNTFTHTWSNGGTTYNVVHNFGSHPDLIVVQFQQSGNWINLTDYATPNYGFLTQPAQALANSFDLTMYYNFIDNSGTAPLRILCFKF
jgi:hypothetical protein